MKKRNKRENIRQNHQADLIVNANPKSSFSEAIKTVRTNLQFTGVDKQIKVILVTSPQPGDGKSMISANLATAYAQENKRVLIIDCDLRKGRQAEIFGIKKSPSAGYSNLILNYIDPSHIPVLNSMEQLYNKRTITLKDYICSTEIKNVDVIPNGPTPPNPIELLGSSKNKELIEALKSVYDIIILDCPPVLGLSDTLVMSKYSDANIITVSSNGTKVELLSEVKKNFEKVNSPITGVIVNKTKTAHSSYYGYYCNSYYGEQ